MRIRPHPHRGRYESERPEDPDFPVDLLLIARPAAEDTHGAWVVRGALVSAPSSEPSWVPGWRDPAYADSDPRVVWSYLRDTGANAVNWEVLEFKIETLDHAAALAGHYSAELTADGHPHGLTGGSKKQPVKEMPLVASDPEERDQSPDPCDTHFHMSVPYPVAEALSWRLAVEIVRRHPKDLWLVQTNPFGDYDCLTLRSITHPASGPSIHINRHGYHAQIQWFGTPPDAPASPPWSAGATTTPLTTLATGCETSIGWQALLHRSAPYLRRLRAHWRCDGLPRFSLHSSAPVNPGMHEPSGPATARHQTGSRGSPRPPPGCGTSRTRTRPLEFGS